MPKPKGKAKGKWIPPWVAKDEEDKKASAKKTKAKAKSKKK